MAVFKPTPQDQRTTVLNASKQLPRNQYTIRFTDEKNSPSKSTGNPMVTLEAEIVFPETIVSPFTGETLEIAGAKIKPIYMSLQVKDLETSAIDTTKTQQAIDRYTDFMKKCGLDIPEEGIDNENPVMGFKGKVVDVILDSEEFVQRATPTPEQKAAGKPGDEIKGQDGKPIKSYKPFITLLLGPSSVDVSHNPMLA